MECTQVLENELDDSLLYKYKVKVAELKVSNDCISIYSGSNRIGRDPEFCSVVFNNMTLSKEHAVIEVEAKDSHIIYDLGSKNKTKLGKMLLKPHVRYHLPERAQIQFGDLITEYCVLPEEESGPFGVINESDDEIVADTPEKMKYKESSSSREESPTIFQMENECLKEYDEVCLRIEKEPMGDNSIQPEAKNGSIAGSCAEEGKERNKKMVSFSKHEGSDGDETDPEDLFLAATQKVPASCISGTNGNETVREETFMSEKCGIKDANQSTCDNIGESAINAKTLDHDLISASDSPSKELDIFDAETQVIEHRNEETKNDFEDSLNPDGYSLKKEMKLYSGGPATNVANKNNQSEIKVANSFKLSEKEIQEMKHGHTPNGNEKSGPHRSVNEDSRLHGENADDSNFIATSQVISPLGKIVECSKEQLLAAKKDVHNISRSNHDNIGSASIEGGKNIVNGEEFKNSSSNMGKVTSAHETFSGAQKTVSADQGPNNLASKEAVGDEDLCGSISETDDENCLVLCAPTQSFCQNSSSAQTEMLRSSAVECESKLNECNALYPSCNEEKVIEEPIGSSCTIESSSVLNVETQVILPVKGNGNCTNIKSAVEEKTSQNKDDNQGERCKGQEQVCLQVNIELPSENISLFDAETQVFDPHKKTVLKELTAFKKENENFDQREQERKDKQEKVFFEVKEEVRESSDHGGNCDSSYSASSICIQLESKQVDSSSLHTKSSCRKSVELVNISSDSEESDIDHDDKKQCGKHINTGNIECESIFDAPTQIIRKVSCSSPSRELETIDLVEENNHVLKIQENDSKTPDQSVPLHDSNDSIFCLPTQIISRSYNVLEQPGNNCEAYKDTVVHEANSHSDSPNESSCTKIQGNPLTKLSDQTINVQTESVEDNSDSIFHLPTQVISKNTGTVDTNLLPPCETTSNKTSVTEHAPEDASIKTDIAMSHETEEVCAQEEDLNDSFFEAATQIIPQKQLEVISTDATCHEKVKIFVTEKDDNDLFSEAVTQVISQESVEKSELLQRETDPNTSLSRSSSYSSIHEAPTQCIDELEAGGQDVPVVSVMNINKPTSIPLLQALPSANDKQQKDPVAGSSRKPESSHDYASFAIDDVELILPSSQELREAGLECIGVAAGNRKPSTSTNSSSPILQKGTRKRPTRGRKGLSLFKRLETSESDSYLNPSVTLDQTNSKVQSSSGANSEKATTSQCKSSKQQTLSQFISVGNTANSEKEREKSRKSRDKKRHSKKVEFVIKEVDGEVPEASLYSSNDSRRSSRQRKMTWKARESCEDHSSPDSNEKKSENKTTSEIKLGSRRKTQNASPKSSDAKNEKDASVKPKRKCSTEIEHTSLAYSKSYPENNKTDLTLMPENCEVSHKEMKTLKIVLTKTKHKNCTKEEYISVGRSESNIEIDTDLTDNYCKEINSSSAHVTKPTELTDRSNLVGLKRSARLSKPSTSKIESKFGTLAESEGVDQIPVSSLSINLKSNSDSSLIEDVEKTAGNGNRRNRSKCSQVVPNSVDLQSDMKSENVVDSSKRKQYSNVFDSQKKRRRTTHQPLVGDQEEVNKRQKLVSSAELKENPNKTKLKQVESEAVLPYKKQNVNVSQSPSKQRNIKSSSLSEYTSDEIVGSGRKSRSKPSVAISSLSVQSRESEKNKSEVLEKIGQNIDVLNASDTLRKSRGLSSITEDKESRKSRLKCSKADGILDKEPKTRDNKRRPGVDVCETVKKRRKSSISKNAEQEENDVKRYSRSTRSAVQNNEFSSEWEPKTSKKVPDSKSQDSRITSPSEKQSKATTASISGGKQDDPVVSKRGFRRKQLPVQSNSDTPQGIKCSIPTTLALQYADPPKDHAVTPPRNSRQRSTAVVQNMCIADQEPTFGKQEGQIRNRRKEGSKEQVLKSDDSSCKSPNVCNSGRKRKLPAMVSSTESDGQSSQGEGTPKRSSRLKQVVSHRIMFTGIACSNEDEVAIKKLGGKIVQEPEECTILITDKVRRTVKFLCIMGQGKPIVSFEWIKQSQQSGQFLEPWNFIVKDKEAEKKYSFLLQRSLKTASSKKFMDGYSIFATPSVKPPPNEMKRIVENCGGHFLTHEPRSGEWPEQCCIISTAEDKRLCNKLKKSCVPIVSAELLLTGILQQRLNINDYILKW